jgi:hypothetical protein
LAEKPQGSVHFLTHSPGPNKKAKIANCKTIASMAFFSKHFLKAFSIKKN